MEGGRVQLDVRSGTTPTIITGRLLILVMRPIVSGADANRARHTDSLIIATGTRLDESQSSGTRRRPSVGRSKPSTAKKLHDTINPNEPFVSSSPIIARKSV